MPCSFEFRMLGPSAARGHGDDMTLFNHANPGPSASADIALDVLADAAHGRVVAAERRVVASPDRFDADEGLALLDAYVSISEASVRQAILDLVLSISGTNPYRRARTSFIRGLGDP